MVTPEISYRQGRNESYYNNQQKCNHAGELFHENLQDKLCIVNYSFAHKF